MAYDVSDYNFTGRLGTDPEVTYGADGAARVRFSVAVTTSYDKKSESERTTWLRVSAFGKPAEIIGQYAGKGDDFAGGGRLELAEWTDREGGKRTSLEIQLRSFKLLGRRVKNEDGTGRPVTGTAAASRGQRSAPVLDEDDDLPF